MERRFPALDGYRGLAVAIVVSRHLFGVRGAWAGVDIFFVLSGYLITNILRGERCEPKFWRVFYIRRIARLAPAYVMLMAATVVFYRLSWHSIWPYYAFFAANFGNMAFTDAMLGPLTPLWSLAVEEHFYLVWPSIVRLCKDRILAFILLGVIFAEPAIRVLGLSIHPHWRIYYFLTPFRLDGLALGALLSIALSNPRLLSFVERSVGAGLIASVGLCLVVFGAFHIYREDHTWLFNAAGYSLIAITSGVALAWLILRPRSLLAKIMSLPPLRFLGRISYGLYLYHVFFQGIVSRNAMAHGYNHNFRISVLTAPVAIFAAWLSFRFVEAPCLALGKRLVGAYRTSPVPVPTAS